MSEARRHHWCNGEKSQQFDVWWLFVVELVTAQAQEINLFHQRMGLIQRTAATSYYFSSWPHEQDITSKKQNSLNWNTCKRNSEENRRTLLLNVISPTEVQYCEFVKLTKSIWSLSPTHPSTQATYTFLHKRVAHLFPSQTLWGILEKKG